MLFYHYYSKVLLFILCIMAIYGCKQDANIQRNPSSIQSNISNKTLPNYDNNLSFKPLTLNDSLMLLDVDKYSLEGIKKLLLFIKDKDQEARIEYKKLYDKVGWAASRKINFSKNDEACRNMFDKIVNKVGFPDNQRFGKEIDSVVFLIFAHASHEYRLKYIDKWEVIVDKGISNSWHFTNIKDRILLWDTGCQFYGTQKVKRENIDKDSIYLKICDIKNLNNRRKKYGLPKIDVNTIIQLDR
jgi:hypothetical protein